MILKDYEFLPVVAALAGKKREEMEERGERGRVSNSLQPIKSLRTNQSLKDI